MMAINPMQWFRRLFEHYRAYHSYGPPRLKYMGYLGAVSYSLFYFLRFTRPNAQPFEDIGLRAVAVLLLVLLALQDQWPEKLKRYYTAYSYPTLLFCLPCFIVLTGLQKGGGMPSISNAFIVLSFLVLVTDWRNTIVMLAVGTGLAAAAYWAMTPSPRIPMDFVAQLPAYVVIVIGGSLFKFSTEQIDAERKVRGQALAGSIAHEMRNPLSQIKHNLEQMQQSLPKPTTMTQVQALAVQEVDALYRHVAESELAVKRGLQVIAMTLDEVSERPMDTATFSHISAAEAVEKAVREYGYETVAEREKVRMALVEDFTFLGDETAYLFVLFNLIKNALYYMKLDPGARMTITIERQQVKVRDSGPGVPAEAVARLFEPFRSVGKSGGTGLGLAYCQRVMRAFGGQIGCESVVGEYTEFTMHFPPVSEQEREAHRRVVLGRAQALFRGKRVLVVDDDAAQRLTTRHKLQPLGVPVDEAADGQRALDMLGRQRYDLVLLDLNMPVLDGYAVAERIRQGHVPANRDVCIVAYTSEPGSLTSVKTRKAGMDGCVSKPCAQMPLVQALHHALEHSARKTPPDLVLLAGRRILIADDNPYNRKAMAASLRHAGATVLEAAHGQEVLDHLDGAASWDAVLMDINMPGMDGLQTAAAIRGSGKAWCNLPIVALTAHSDQPTVEAAQAAGMNDFLTKPVEAALLYEKLYQLLGGTTPVAGPLPPARPADADQAAGDGLLLNLDRLESYRRIGMLDELLTDYLPEMGRLLERLEASVPAADMQETRDALHSLLGMSGEAGARRLYQYVRSVYVPMVEEHRWPAAGWLTELVSLSTQTEQALRAYARVQAAVKG
jgi:two-component system CAI-1 autoinducer sensor kinase/phosphatase CqsS